MQKSIKIGHIDDLTPGSCKSIDIEEYSFALYNVDGTYYVTDNACPHMAAPLGDGELFGNIVVCPWHEWKFDVKVGTCLAAPGELDIATYKVDISGDEIYVIID